MSYTQWKFEKDDEVVTARLSSAERDLVTRWQTDDGYMLEFHTGHDTGNPIYVRKAGEKGGKNAPKFDTKNKSASDYYAKDQTTVSLDALANGNKLAGLKSATKEDIKAIMKDSWTSLALLAQRYWDGESAPVEVVDNTVKCKKCNTQFEKPAIRPPTGMAPCPKCKAQVYVG